jgi:predicted RNase H-like HicB family nuclease
MKYVVIYEKAAVGFSAYAPDLPGCVSSGDTLELVMLTMREAVLGHIRDMRDRGESVPAPTAVATNEIAVWEEPLILKYQSGEEIMRGDQILYHGEPGEIDFVATGLTGDEALDWYMYEFGGGLSIKPHSVFIDAESLPDTEDLEFVSRANNPL